MAYYKPCLDGYYTSNSYNPLYNKYSGFGRWSSFDDQGTNQPTSGFLIDASSTFSKHLSADGWYIWFLKGGKWSSQHPKKGKLVGGWTKNV